MKKISIAVGVVIVLLIAAMLIIPTLIPAEVYKAKIEETLSAKLGRDVSIAGDIKVAAFPLIKAKAENVTIANADGFDGGPLASMSSLDAGVKLLPLLSKKVEITRFDLVDAKVNLIKAKDGKVNWAFGEQISSNEPEPDAGPFRRDGRYSDLEVSLGNFALTNAAILYVDHQAETKQDLSAVNLELVLTGMDKPFALNGNFVYNGTPMSLDLDLDTPASFLNGQVAPMRLKLASDVIDISADGEFTESQIVTFDMNFDGNIPSVAALDKAFGITNPYAALAQSAKLSGNLAFDGEALRGTGVDAKLASAIIKNDFKGDFTAGKAPSASGKLNTNILNLQGLLTVLELEIPQAAAVNSVDLSAELASDGKTTNAKNISVNVKGDKLTAAYSGAATYGETLALDGMLTASSSSLSGLMSDIGMDVPSQAGVLGDLKFDANVKGSPENLSLKNVKIITNGDQLNAAYTGDINLDKTIALNGDVSADSPSVPSLLAALGIDNPQAVMLGGLTIKAGISGPVDALDIKGVSAKASDGMLNASFEGNAKLGKHVRYTGQLDADIPSVRALAKLTGVELTPSSDSGQIYEKFSINGTATGSATTASFSNATIKFDHLQGTGDFKAAFSGKPVIDGTLALAGLDIRPYMAAMAAQNPTGQIQPWSEEPLNFEALKMLDAKLVTTTPNIITDRMEIGNSTITSTIKDGVLRANVPNMKLYGGQGNMDININANPAVPRIAMDFTLNKVDAKSFLGAAAGFTKLTGNTGTTVKITGQGQSQAQIMQSLDGNGNFELSEGVVSGIDVAQFISNLNTSNLQSMLTSRQLPAGIGNAYNTPFDKLDGLFTIDNGVVTIGDFDLNALNVRAEGGGTLDLGKQNIDFSLRPRLKNGNGLAAFGIPLKFTGGFGSVKAGLDTDLMSQIVTAKAKQELTKKLTNQVGGDVGSIIGGVLGGQTSSSSQQGQAGQNAAPKDPLNGLLGDVLGQPKPKTEPAPGAKPEDKKAEKKEEPKPEDELENALNSLFGSKKND